MSLRAAPLGELSQFTRSEFTHADLSFGVFTRGSGPAVLVLTEIPGISPQVLGFANRLVELGFTTVLPDLFGIAGKDPIAAGMPYAAKVTLQVCVRREFTMFATGKTAPIIEWLRALGRDAHARCGGPGIGVIGMCFSGGFALAMATDASVLVPVMSQPSLPLPLTKKHRQDLGCSPEDLATIRARDDLSVIGLRFHGDPLVPAERFTRLKEVLGDRFIAVELDQSMGHPANTLSAHHSVLTRSLIDEPGQPTWQAMQQVFTLLTTTLSPDR